MDWSYFDCNMKSPLCRVRNGFEPAKAGVGSSSKIGLDFRLSRHLV